MTTGRSGLIARFVASSIVMIVTIVITVLALTIAELYLTGHGYGSISREFAGTATSPSDIVLLLAAAAAFLGTWLAMSRKSSGR